MTITVTTPSGLVPAPRAAAAVPLRVAVIALSSTSRLAKHAVAMAERLASVPGVEVLGGGAQLCTPAQASRPFGADVDVLYVVGHHNKVDQRFMGLDLVRVGWSFPPVIAPAIVLDTCYGNADDLRAAVTAARPRQLPPAAVFTTAHDEQAPFTHDVLFGPLLAAALTGGRPASWSQRLTDAMAQALASTEMQPHARRDWQRWGVHQIQGTR